MHVFGNIYKSLSQRFDTRNPDIDYLKSEISYSETGKSLLNYSEKIAHVRFEFSVSRGSYAKFVPGDNFKRPVIGLNPEYCNDEKIKQGDLLTALPHELRHCWQDRNGSAKKVFENYYMPRDAIFIHRALEADAEAISVQIAWELKEKKHFGAWSSYLNGEYSDIAIAFENSVTANHDHSLDGTAARAAYNQWYLSPDRVKYYDEKIIKSITFNINRCNFPKQHAESASQVIEQLQQAPCGIKYLRGVPEMISTDPVYTKMDPEIEEKLWNHEISCGINPRPLQTAEQLHKDIAITVPLDPPSHKFDRIASGTTQDHGWSISADAAGSTQEIGGSLPKMATNAKRNPEEAIQDFLRQKKEMKIYKGDNWHKEGKEDFQMEIRRREQTLEQERASLEVDPETREKLLAAEQEEAKQENINKKIPRKRQ